jgi:ABC-type polysaccharide/polyol phosphate transport system ATPase subunit
MVFSGVLRTLWFFMSRVGAISDSERICFKDVVQRFRVIQERPDTLREAFAHLFRNRVSYHDFDALKNISFVIREGETVAFVGRNGSGKSTILKIIAGVYRPSAGIVRVSGKVSALIELGAGFHPDLTGRENIVLNGLLLGLSRQEIRSREQQILDFAELGDFIDSPVKQYSSGMYARLGFAVATEVDPDVLLIDEILAVGDIPFQEKCMARIDDFRRRGKTIVFVSHDLGSVRKLCPRALLIHNGVVRIDGSTDQVLAEYEGVLQQAISA